MSCCDLDFGSETVAIRPGSDQFKDDPVVVIGRAVYKNLWRPVEHSHNDINLAIVVKIAECRPSMCSRDCEIWSSFCTQVFEDKSALVAEQAICQHKRPLLDFHGVIQDCRIGSEQILIAVVIEIKGASSPGGKPAGERGKSSLRCGVFKLATSYIFV